MLPCPTMGLRVGICIFLKWITSAMKVPKMATCWQGRGQLISPWCATWLYFPVLTKYKYFYNCCQNLTSCMLFLNSWYPLQQHHPPSVPHPLYDTLQHPSVLPYLWHDALQCPHVTPNQRCTLYTVDALPPPPYNCTTPTNADACQADAERE